MIARPKDLFDEAVPSGNGAATGLLLRLAALLGEGEYDRRARATIMLVTPALAQYPTALGKMLSGLDFVVSEVYEIAIIGKLQSGATRTMIDAVNGRYLPTTVVALAEPDDEEAARVIPLLAERSQRDGQTTAYVCREFACQAPTTDAKQMLRDLGYEA